MRIKTRETEDIIDKGVHRIVHDFSMVEVFNYA